MTKLTKVRKARRNCLIPNRRPAYHVDGADVGKGSVEQAGQAGLPRWAHETYPIAERRARAQRGVAWCTLKSEGNGRFLYSFTGTPEMPMTFNSSRQIWFLKHRNVLIEVWGDGKLAAKLSNALRIH